MLRRITDSGKGAAGVMTSGPDIVLIAPDSEIEEQVRSALSGRFAIEADEPTILLQAGTARETVEQARVLHGGRPLGFVARNQVHACEALTAGADDVLPWPPRDEAEIVGFVDRTRLRAAVRREHESRTAFVRAEKLAAL